MMLRRLPCLLSPRRLRFCRANCRRPYRALFDLSFLRRGACTIVLRDGATASFARGQRDDRFWDWFFAARPGRVDFTEHGELRLSTEGPTVLLRPGSADFLFYREIFLEDVYGLAEIPHPIRNAIDLGGNVGLFSCALLPQAKRVITVEPIETNHRQALRNIGLNAGNPDDVLRGAVTGASKDPVRIFLSRRMSGVHSISSHWARRAADGDCVEVEGIPLASLLERLRGEPVDLVKCDIEGAEYDVFLDSSAQVLEPVRRIHMEAHISAPDFPPSLLLHLVAHLERCGFAVEADRPLRNGRFAERDAVMLRAVR